MPATTDNAAGQGLASRLRRWFAPQSAAASRKRLILQAPAPTIYAIGDVHGALGALRELERLIVADAADRGGEKLLIMLGDYVDRGQSSAQVIDHLLAPPPTGFDRICLAGNHEAVMLEAVVTARVRDWFDLGGDATAQSYGLNFSGLIGRRALRDGLRSHIPVEHVEFLAGLPILIETADQIFVHAGLRPGVSLEAQSDADLLWFRDGFAADYSEFGRTVVHGHTPLTAPLVSRYRVAIDTAAYASGRLTAVCFSANKPPLLLGTSASIAS